MSIDDAIKIFNTLLAFHNVTCTIDELEEVCKMAIDTMRKYQKIEQILDDCDLEGWEVLEMIRKVVEYGAENNHNASNT